MLSGVGISLGEEIIIIPAGALVGHGELGFWPTLIAAYVGVVCSDLTWFTLCHRYGTRLLHLRGFKRLVHPRRLLEAKHQLERRGAWMIVMARFIPGTRTTAITVAGMLHMPFWKFALATALCALLTSPAQVAVGMLSARVAGIESTAELIQHMLAMVMLVIAMTMIVGFYRQYVTRKRRLPRARARWLRRFRMPRIRSLERARRREEPAARPDGADGASGADPCDAVAPGRPAGASSEPVAPAPSPPDTLRTP
jgi:membrane protein DedA with SNARE-associated domain